MTLSAHNLLNGDSLDKDSCYIVDYCNVSLYNDKWLFPLLVSCIVVFKFDFNLLIKA